MNIALRGIIENSFSYIDKKLIIYIYTKICYYIQVIQIPLLFMKKCNSRHSIALVALVAVQRASQQDTNIHRDIATELRLQERLLTDLRAEQEADRAHAAATEVEEEVEYTDFRDHYRAYRKCTRLGYSRSRLSACIDSMLHTGECSGT